MLAKPTRDQCSSLRCQFDPADTSVARVILARDETLFDQTLDRHANGARREPDFRAKSVYRERSFMQERLEHAKIRIPQLGLPDAFGRVRHHSLEGLHEDEPDMNPAGVLGSADSFSLHKIIY